MVSSTLRNLCRYVSTVTGMRDRRGPHEAGVDSLFDLNTELHPSLSVAAIFPLGQAAMSSDWADPSSSESSTQLNSSSRS